MKSKNIVYSNIARTKLAAGVDKLANSVTATLGPAGRNVIIDQEGDLPSSTKDGVTVAKSIKLKDKVENVGAQIVKQASIKTAEQAGDGTTTSTLLAQNIYNAALDVVADKGINAVELKREIDTAVEEVLDFLQDGYSEDIVAEDQLKQVATISANNDSSVGELIATAIDKVGVEGVVTIEESKTGETYLETVEGMQFSRGFKSPYFVTDNSSMTAVLKDPYILITDKRLNSVKELLPILEAVSQQNKSVLVIADDIDGEALSTMVVNKMRGILPVCAVKAPDYGDRKKAILEDIATLTGGTVISTEKGMKLDRFDTNWLGKAGKVTVGKDTTTIIDAKGEEEAINARVDELKTQIDETIAPFEKEKLQDRLAAFLGGVAVVHVGGHTEVEMREKKDRVEDALHATKAALEEGILPGGGIALLNASYHINTKDKNEGTKILIKACQSPFEKILHNAGYEQSNIETIKDDLKARDKWSGYNPRTNSVCDMFTEGIIDPTKVTRLALQNAASVAGTMLITESIITDDPDEVETNQQDPNLLMG